MNALHPDALMVMDADMANPDALRLTRAEAEAVAIEASYMQDDHGGGYLAWVARVLYDIRHGTRDRRGRRTYGNASVVPHAVEAWKEGA